VDKLIEHFLPFFLTHVQREQNLVVDKLAIFSSRPNKHCLNDNLDCNVISLYHPFMPDNDKAWNIFESDEYTCCFLID